MLSLKRDQLGIMHISNIFLVLGRTLLAKLYLLYLTETLKPYMESYCSHFYISENFFDLEKLPLLNILNKPFILFCLHFLIGCLLQTNFKITNDDKEKKNQIHKHR